MTSDAAGGDLKPGSTFFPASGPTAPPAVTPPPAGGLAARISTVTGLSRQSLQALDRGTLERTLVELCAQLGNRTPADLAGGDLHENGTLRIASQVAVWMIGRVSEAYAPGKKLVKLSQVRDIEALRSIGGLADLLIRSIRKDMGDQTTDE